MYKKQSKVLIALMALMLVAVMILSACGRSESSPAVSEGNDSASFSASSKEESQQAEETEQAEPDDENTVYEFTNGYDETVDVGTPQTKLDPEEVYKSVTYIPEMFLGTHQLLGGDKAISEYKQNTPYYKFNEAAYGGGGVEREITYIPYKIKNELKKDSTGILYTMKGLFVNSKGDDEYRNFLYTVDSAKRTLTHQEIKDIDYNSDYDGITAYKEGQLKLSYTFVFKGLSLTLTKDSDSYEVSAEGKKNLDEFLDIYTSVVLSKENKDNVASIVVEGHTDTNGTREYNQKLSENRAKAVADYCTSSVPEMKKIITSKGYSFDKPIYNEDGTVNMEASRCVEFKFKLEIKK